MWPKGYGFDAKGDDVRILDAAGARVGTVGGAFKFGGGEVPYLHEGLGFTPDDRAFAEARCPGRFWIASPG